MTNGIIWATEKICEMDNKYGVIALTATVYVANFNILIIASETLFCCISASTFSGVTSIIADYVLYHHFFLVFQLYH